MRNDLCGALFPQLIMKLSNDPGGGGQPPTTPAIFSLATFPRIVLWLVLCQIWPHPELPFLHTPNNIPPQPWILAAQVMCPTCMPVREIEGGSISFPREQWILSQFAGTTELRQNYHQTKLQKVQNEIRNYVNKKCVLCGLF